MKKLVLTLVLGVFAFGASGFKAQNHQNFAENCDDGYSDIYDFAVHHGHSETSAQNLAAGYWGNCMENGGYSPLANLISKFW